VRVLAMRYLLVFCLASAIIGCDEPRPVPTQQQAPPPTPTPEQAVLGSWRSENLGLDFPI